MKEKKNLVKDIPQLSESAEVKEALKNITGLSKPPRDLQKYMDNLYRINLKSNDYLEKCLGIFTAWQNYFGEQSIIADAIRTVAESQMKREYSLAVKQSKGTIMEKKEVAVIFEQYQRAESVYNKAKIIHEAVELKFANCDRAYRLISRILTKRLGIKEW